MRSCARINLQAGRKERGAGWRPDCLHNAAGHGELQREACEAGFRLGASLGQSRGKSQCWVTPAKAREQTSGSGAAPSEECNKNVLDDNQGILQQ